MYRNLHDTLLDLVFDSDVVFGAVVDDVLHNLRVRTYLELFPVIRCSFGFNVNTARCWDIVGLDRKFETLLPACQLSRILKIFLPPLQILGSSCSLDFDTSWSGTGHRGP